jgi:hypothetical protein
LVEFEISSGLISEARAVGSRRRGNVLESAIFNVVLQELAETGYVNFSIERGRSRGGHQQAGDLPTLAEISN